MRFEFATAGRIVFGEGAAKEVGALAAELGTHALLITGRTVERAGPVGQTLREAGLTVEVFPVPGEPTFAIVRQAVAAARQASVDMLVAVGGGSPLDAAKAVAALLTNGGDPLDYAEVIGPGKSFTKPAVPFIAIPTTAGTGTEVTRNAVLASPEQRVKVSLRSPYLLPTAAVVDPELTYSLPPAQTAYTGLDALTQLIEPYVSARANPISDAISAEGIRRVARSLRRAVQTGGDVQARQDMALASLFGGIALANAGLGAVHGFANPFGGMFPRAPHGAVCASLLTATTEVNILAARQRSDGGRLLARYADVARLLTGEQDAGPEQATAWLRALCHGLSIPPLGAYGLRQADIPDLIERASKASSMRANPVALTPDEMRQIVVQAM